MTIFVNYFSISCLCLVWLVTLLLYSACTLLMQFTCFDKKVKAAIFGDFIGNRSYNLYCICPLCHHCSCLTVFSEIWQDVWPHPSILLYVFASPICVQQDKSKWKLLGRDFSGLLHFYFLNFVSDCCWPRYDCEWRMMPVSQEHRVLLTGTPLQNNVEELYSLLSFLEPKQFTSSDAFMADFGKLESEAQVDKLKAVSVWEF